MKLPLRSTRWFDSLIVRITLPTVFLVLLLSAASSYFLGKQFARTHEAHNRRRFERFASVVEGAYRRETDGRHDDMEWLLKLLCQTTGKSAFVTDSEWRVRAACGDLQRDRDPVLDGQRLVYNGKAWIRRVRDFNGGGTCERCHGGQKIIGHLAVDASAEEGEAEVRAQQRANLLAGGLLAIAVSLALVLVQILLVFRPVRVLTAAVEQLKAGDHSARVTVARRDEIGQLGQRINDMATSIERAKVELDRTHRRELAQSEKLAALGQSFTSVTHEIKNQLAGIIGALKVVESEAAADDPKKAVLAKILSQMERMAATAVAALDFARPLKPAVAAVDLADLLDRTIFFIERQASEQKVVLRKRYAAGLLRASIDEDLMKQVFLNILLNGVQAMPRGGTLAVEAKPAGENAVEVIISDQGVGIPLEDRERIFSPFFSTKPHGTGLGLYIARQIVETQRGEIRVDSRPGQGTSFAIRLPAAPPSPEKEVHAAG